MKVAILETGEFHEAPDNTTVFSTQEKALKSIPIGFVKQDTYLDGEKYVYYVDELNESWLTIKLYEVK